MAINMQKKKLTAPIIRARKGSAEPLVCLTAYTAPIASILNAHCDILLVGDSVATTIYGAKNTLNVSLEMMIRHGECVVRAAPDTHVIVDLPFGSYQASPEQAFMSAARIISETGCDSVKLEGGTEMAETIAFLSERGIPVCAHIGLRPQSVNTHGGYGAFGKTEKARLQLLDDAKAVSEAGAFATVLEGTIDHVADEIVRFTPVPVIGIGASPICDGQILVSDDMLGMTTGRLPKFVKTYGQVGMAINEAAASYATEVRSRAFPTSDYLYKLSKVAV